MHMGGAIGQRSKTTQATPQGVGNTLGLESPEVSVVLSGMSNMEQVVRKTSLCGVISTAYYTDELALV